MIEIDWAGLLEKGGIGAICLAVIYVGYKIFDLFIKQWANSTETQKQSNEAVNKNTQAFEKLSEVFEKQAERELEYQERMWSLLKSGVKTAEDTNSKVTDIHRKIV
jgi:predicted RNA-binding protein with RPS1 domain